MTSLFISTLIVGWLEFYKIIRMPFRLTAYAGTGKPDADCLNVPPPITPLLSIPILSMGYPLLLEKPPGLTRPQMYEMIRVMDPQIIKLLHVDV